MAADRSVRTGSAGFAMVTQGANRFWLFTRARMYQYSALTAMHNAMLIKSLCMLEVKPPSISDRGPLRRKILHALSMRGQCLTLACCVALQTASLAMCQNCADMSIKQPTNGQGVDNPVHIEGKTVRSNDGVLWMFAHTKSYPNEWWPLDLYEGYVERDGTFNLDYTVPEKIMQAPNFSIVPVVLDKKRSETLKKCCLAGPSFQLNTSEKCEGKQVTVHKKIVGKQ